MGIIGERVYAEVLLMVLLTTVLAPLVLRAVMRRRVPARVLH
ncbi:hypothetical protein ACFSC4_01210 [Deinococcus malanensis]